MADRGETVRLLRLLSLAMAAALSPISWCEARAESSEPVCEREMARAARESGIPLEILYAVGLTETGARGSLSPWDMNVDGRAVHSATLDDALKRFAEESARGARFIDIGCMQINHHFHGTHFVSLKEMFDPEHNVRYAAAFLKTLRDQEGSWTLAVARYNAGPGNPTAQRNYVCTVIANMVASGQGAWTPNARAFCR
jgi:soluble lytic murein transglycosylase-like protein